MGASRIPFFSCGAAAGADLHSAGFAVQWAADPRDLREFLESAAAAGEPHAVVCLDPGARLSAGFPGMVRDAIGHAERLVDRWLLLTAGGIAPDLEVIDYGYYAGAQSLTCGGDLTPCLAPFPQLQVWNLRAWADATRGGPRLPAAGRGDLAAVWGASSSGLPSFVSPHLRFGRPGGHETARPPLDERLSTLRWAFGALPDGAIRALRVLGDNDAGSRRILADESRRAELRQAVAGIGLADAVRGAVRASRPDARISVVVRTILTRPALLRRTLASLAAASGQVPLHEVLVTSERPELAASVDSLQRDFPDLALRPVSGPGSTTPSRTTNMIAGAQAATGDYVWFIDDDDAADPDALRLLQGAVHSRYHPILIGDCDVYQEAPAPLDEAGAAIDRTHLVRSYPAAHWPTAFSGVNPVPFCAVVYPRPILQRVVAGDSFRHYLNEDYALLLQALNDPEAEVRVIRGKLADISLRPGAASDNTTNLCGPEERSVNISGLMADTLAPGSGYRVVLAQLGNEVARLTAENRRLRGKIDRRNERDRQTPAGPGLSPPG